MNKSSRILEACGAFLNEHAPAYVAPTIVKPYPDSSLHEKTLEVLQHELYEARRVQHLLTQFSAEETKHLAYVDEATSIITYKQLDELSKDKLLNYTRAAASDMQIQGMRQGSASVSAANSENPLVKQDKKDQEKTAAKKASKRFGGILKATRRLATEEVVEESELPVYAKGTKVNVVVGNTPSTKKTVTGTVVRHVPPKDGYSHAHVVDVGGPESKTIPTTSIKLAESEQLDELSKETLGSYVNKSSDDGDVKAGREQGVTKAAYRTQGLSHKPGSVGQFKKYKTDDVKTESAEPLDELSVKTLKNYKEKASDAVGSYKYGSKSPTMDIGTVNKRVKGFVKAGAKLSDRIKAATTLIKSNESVEHLDEAYRGKHPEKINSVSGAGEKGAVHVTLNNGSKHKIYAKDTNGAMPAVGDHISKYVSKPLVTEDAVNEARGPLKDHPYHTKSDSELHFIIKDAGEAAKAMKDHSPKSEAKYLDQVNDASTVLHYRKNGGKQLPKETAKPSTVIESFDNNSARNRIKNLLG